MVMLKSDKIKKIHAFWANKLYLYLHRLIDPGSPYILNFIKMDEAGSKLQIIYIDYNTFYFLISCLKSMHIFECTKISQRLWLDFYMHLYCLTRDFVEHKV